MEKENKISKSKFIDAIDKFLVAHGGKSFSEKEEEEWADETGDPPPKPSNSVTTGYSRKYLLETIEAGDAEKVAAYMTLHKERISKDLADCIME